MEIYLKVSDNFNKEDFELTEKKDYFILIEKLLFVLVVFPGEISELLADKETEVSLKASKALSFSGKCLNQNIPCWFTLGKLMKL